MAESRLSSSLNLCRKALIGLTGNGLIEAMLQNPPTYNATPYGSSSDLTRDDGASSSSSSSLTMNLFQREEYLEDKSIRDILVAINNSDVETVSSVLTSGMANHRCNSGWCLIHYAAYHGQAKIVEVLHKKGARLSEMTKNGHLPIHLAAWRGQADVVSFLLKLDPELVSCRSEDDYIPLHWAAMEGHTEVTSVLLAAKTPLNVKSTNGTTALHFAAQNGHNRCLLQLLNSKADPNAQNEMGDTPLHCATWKGFKATVEILLEYRGDPTITNNEGNKPAQDSKGRVTEIIRVLNMAERALQRQST